MNPFNITETPKKPFAATGLGIATNTVLGLPKATASVAKNFFPASAEFIKTTGNIFREGLAYAMDKNVREQYKAGNTDILPTITNTKQVDLFKKTIAAAIEAAVYKAIPSTVKMTLNNRLGVGALQGLGFALANGLAKDKSFEEIREDIKGNAALFAAFEVISPYIGPLLNSELKNIPKEFKNAFSKFAEETKGFKFGLSIEDVSKSGSKIDSFTGAPIHEVDLSKIRPSERGVLKQDTIDQVVKDGEVKRPIELKQESDGTFTVIDGENRINATKQMEKQKIPAVFEHEKPPLTGATKPLLQPEIKGEVSPSSSGQQVPKNISLPDNIPSIESPVNKLLQALKEAQPIRGKQEKIYSAERSKRLGAVSAMQKKTTGEKGFYSELSQLKGELPKVQYDSIRNKVGQSDIDSLFNMIKDSPKLDLFEQINARSGLAKIFGHEGGTVPTFGELKLLNQVFPKEVIDALLAKRPLLTRIGEGVIKALNIPRSILASFDLSAPFRQGVFMVGRKEFYSSFIKMFKQFGSERAFKAVQEEIFSRPTYKLMKESKLALTQMDTFLTDREEQFISNWAEKIPVLGKVIRASGRAYTGFLNKLRADVFDTILKKAKDAGVDIDSDMTKSLATFINSATGRGKLGTLERAAPALNAIFFSPRLMASRFNMLNPIFYTNLHPFVRKQAIKSLLSFGAIATTVLTLAKMGGAKVNGDPRNADFGKIKIGDTRLDILGGFQQYIRLASQLISGKIVSSTTGKTLTLGEGYKPLTRLDILQRFFQNKENPIASFITDFLQGTDATGKKFKLSTELANRFIPLIAQDLTEALKEYGIKGALFSIPATFGVGVQTYKATNNSKTTNPFNL